MHRNRPTNAVANQDDGGRSLTVAGSNHIGYIAVGAEQVIRVLIVESVAVLVVVSIYKKSLGCLLERNGVIHWDNIVNLSQED